MLLYFAVVHKRFRVLFGYSEVGRFALFYLLFGGAAVGLHQQFLIL